MRLEDAEAEWETWLASVFGKKESLVGADN